jgi:hypothetical protein
MDEEHGAATVRLKLLPARLLEPLGVALAHPE